jgi:hypothetical protein
MQMIMLVMMLDAVCEHNLISLILLLVWSNSLTSTNLRAQFSFLHEFAVYLYLGWIVLALQRTQKTIHVHFLGSYNNQISSTTHIST